MSAVLTCASSSVCVNPFVKVTEADEVQWVMPETSLLFISDELPYQCLLKDLRNCSAERFRAYEHPGEQTRLLLREESVKGGHFERCEMRRDCS